ncbi:Phage tail length tape-measure protein [Kosakonia radicincitans]|uniref:phage tail tape measure protein n=1 Tax=Kosakonia radicincitans TaxID=283686 RepID=UPI00118222C0|nr:phage tail tape measure protein [Kosakonia radicincitans]VVT43524.1 Phage tail length tape-measure protein [Kosakonia radicincitans]
MAGEFELKALITGVDRLSPALGRMQKSISKFKRQAEEGGRGGLVMAAGLAAGLTLSLRSYAQQEDAATGLKVAMMQANGQVGASFENINKLAIGLGNKLPGTTADFQNMMQMLVRQGIPAENILGGLGEATAYLAVQLKKTPEAAAEFAAKMQDATGTASNDMMGLFDTIQKAFYLGVDDTNMLSFFAKTSSVLKMVNKDGLKAAQGLAPISVMMDQMGMEGESAGNALRKVIQSGLDVRKVKAVNKVLGRQKLGISLDFTDGKGAFGGLDNLFTQLSKLRKLTDVKRTGVLKALFGDDAETLQVVNALIDKGKDGYDQIQDRMNRQASLNKRVEAQLNTLTNLWDAMTGTAVNGLASIGSAFSGDTKKVITWLGDISEKFGKFAEENPKVIRGLVGAAAGFIGLKLAMLGVNTALGFIGGSLKMTPMGAFLRLAAIGIGYVIANWDKFGPVIENLLGKIDSLTSGTDGWKIALAGVAAYIAGKWLATIISSVRTVGTEADIANKKMGLLGKFGLASMLYAPVEGAMESTIGKTSAGDWMKNNGLFFASDWTPFFNRQNMEEYEKGINRGSGAAGTTPKGELRVSFENAPPGMKVDPAGPGFQGISYDVGYTNIGRPY